MYSSDRILLVNCLFCINNMWEGMPLLIYMTPNFIFIVLNGRYTSVLHCYYNISTILETVY